MMDEAIRGFAKQFEYEPEVENEDKLIATDKFLVCGMGGSHLAAGILKNVAPELDILIHRDYDLPAEGLIAGRLVVASSYSGNTEEVLSAFEQAHSKNLPLVAIATGGKLIEAAKQAEVPYIQMPATGIQPRSALGYSFLALLKATGQNKLFQQAVDLSTALDPTGVEKPGQELAEKLRGHVPVIYASTRNLSLVYNWKIKFNETGKIPAFYNVIPELNHNEMTGFDAKAKSESLSEVFHFIFLMDSEDHPQNKKRMAVLKKLYEDRNFTVTQLELSGESRLERMFNSLILADWAAYYTATGYGLEAEQVPMVEEFKKLISS